ncbi:hypothetical protein ANO11243_053310 [Dothideomycetidae sp. 11243]|nr:hypothetical protein ANO11243_053310 [fungal sp. No.11243]
MESDDQDPAVLVDAGSSDEEEAQNKGPNAYSSLLQTLCGRAQDAVGPRKRRKLSQPGTPALPNSANGHALESTLNATNDWEIAKTAPEDDVEAESSAGEESGSENEPEDADGDGLNDESPDDEDNASADPYSIHFSPAEGAELASKIKDAAASNWELHQTKRPGWKITRQTCPGCGVSDRVYKTPKDFPLKQRLRENISSVSFPPGAETSDVVSALFNYQDLLYSSRSASAPAFRDQMSLHILNHILKGRDRVLRNNARLSASADLDDEGLRDQGFTRPKVLILLETREQCYRWISSIMRYFGPEQRENWSRFESSFHADPHLPSSMPEDHLSLFDGNADNDFRLAVKFTRKTIKLFASFYQSDLLICSPLGLRRVIGDSDPKKRDSDFLSSIEILAMDQVHAMQAQNWSHVAYCISHLNKQPRDSHGADFTRVKAWYLDGQAKYLRQTIIASPFLTPEINSLFNSNALNISGRVKLQPEYDGTIQSLSLPSGIKQTFSRFDSSSPTADPDARFAFFSSAVLPAIVKAASASSSISPAGILLLVPTYLDFVRVRNFFAASTATENVAFGAVSEYSSVTESRRARSHFVSGKHSVLLYSVRAHHFHRYRIKGVKRVVWYGLPDDDVFYKEVVEMIANTVDEGKAGATEVGCRAVFSKWDGMKLERIVGSSRVKQMLADRGGDTYDFI